MIIALARPQMSLTRNRTFKEGIDIVLAIDVSTSMNALDFTIGGKRFDRVYIVKKVVIDFINSRPDDRIGVVAFAANPYVASPLTLDHDWLLANLDRLKTGMVEDGTAIGSGIMAALNRLKHSKAKTKIIILLTDGRNNTGKIAPLTAAEAAQALNVKMYTIGAGSLGLVPYPVQDVFGRMYLQNIQLDLDEDTLQKIATITNGKYFRATDTASLEKIYKEIDRMEKTPFKRPENTRYKEIYGLFLLWGLVFLLLEQLLSATILRKIP
jgi:Ca-activated chloride channel family protein